MAAVTVASKTPAVNIITPMTAIAMIGGLLMFSQIRPMALFTVDLSVFPFQREISLIVMIKGP